LTRALAIMAGTGLASGIAGAVLLGRRPATAEAAYALRIAGMMLFALGLFLAGFAAVGSMAGAA
jgi:hypothetical protein